LDIRRTVQASVDALDSGVVTADELGPLYIRLSVRLDTAIFATKRSRELVAAGVTCAWNWPEETFPDLTDKAAARKFARHNLELGLNGALRICDEIDLQPAVSVAREIAELLAAKGL
jgi:hypothetical protein